MNRATRVLIPAPEPPLTAAVVVSVLLFSVSVFAAQTVEGRVLGGGAPIARSTVTLWLASADSPKQLGQTQTGDDGRFTVSGEGARGSEGILYIIAKGGEPSAHKGRGDNPAIALLSVIGSNPPAHVTVNEFTTVASVWTNNQFIDATAIRGHALGLRIAAMNVPNFVDIESGGYGVMIQDGFNSTQTPTMANFATLANVMAGCVTRVKADACTSFSEPRLGRMARRRRIHSLQPNQSRAARPTNPNGSSRYSMPSILCRKRAEAFALLRSCPI